MHNAHQPTEPSTYLQRDRPAPSVMIPIAIRDGGGTETSLRILVKIPTFALPSLPLSLLWLVLVWTAIIARLRVRVREISSRCALLISTSPSLAVLGYSVYRILCMIDLQKQGLWHIQDVFR
jgi:hypothetical protein